MIAPIVDSKYGSTFMVSPLTDYLPTDKRYVRPNLSLTSHDDTAYGDPGARTIQQFPQPIFPPLH